MTWTSDKGAQRACQIKVYLHRNRKGSNPFTIMCYSILFYYSPVKSCQESTCQKVVFHPDEYKHKKFLRHPYNVQRKARFVVRGGGHVDIARLQPKIEEAMQTWKILRRKLGPPHFLPYVCSFWNNYTNFKWTWFPKQLHAVTTVCQKNTW